MGHLTTMNNKLKYKKKGKLKYHKHPCTSCTPNLEAQNLEKNKKTIQFEVSVELYCIASCIVVVLYCYKQSKFRNTDIEVVAIFHIY